MRSSICIALLATLVQGCTTAYRAHVRGPSVAGESARAAIEHCLASLGFTDRSAEGLNPQSIEEELELVAVWEPEPGSLWSPSPFATATLRWYPDRWSVTLVPPRQGGEQAQFFAETLARCLALHSSQTVVEIESELFLDLR